MLTPLSNPATPEEQRYNQSHTRSRVVVEQTFGILKARFKCLHKSGGALQYEPAKCAKIAVASMLLRNYCINRRIPLAEPVDNDDDGQAQEEDVGHLGAGHGNAERRMVIQQAFALQ